MARKPAPRRRAPLDDEGGLPLWLPITAGATLFLLMTGFWIYKHTPDNWGGNIQNKIIDAAADAGMRVEDIYITGRQDLSHEGILDKVDVTRGTPILAVDTAAVQSRLMELPPVHDARVIRLWPDRLLIQIQERVPIALWQKDQKLSPIDGDGVVLTYQHADALSSLPVVVGDEAPKLTRQLLLAVEQYPELKSQLRAATYVSGRRWDLLLKSGMQVKLPEGDVRAGMRRLMRFADEHLIFAKPIAVVDLRLEDRVVVKPIPNAAAPTPADTKPKQQI